MPAEIILFEFAKFVLGKLSPLLIDEARLFLGVDDELDKLGTNLNAIKAVLQDAEKQQQLRTVREWLQNLEDLVYEIDDLFDDIAIEAFEREKSGESWVKQVSRFLSCSNPHLFQSKLAHRIRDISGRLEVVSDARRNFQLKSEFVKANEERETHSKLPKAEILGRDEDQKAIIDLVLNCGDRERLSVVPVVGFGGVGKTTLAKLIFNDPSIESNFDVKLWVYASENFSVKKILEQIVRNICEDGRVLSTVEEMQIMLVKALKERKYFLILDDLWIEDPIVWENLRELLDGGATGSTVVVTTRVPKVALTVKNVVDEYRLEPLSRDICLQIFKRLAFGGEGSCRRIQPNLEEMAGKIVDKCGGLPLAVTVLGKLLHGETDELVWQQTVINLEHGHKEILEVLKLSYDQLPSYLKPCFRTLACYLQGSMTDAQVFISTWMALGFLNSAGSTSFEHAGRRYINELLSKSFLHREEYNFGDLIREFEIHDFVHDLAKYTADEEMAVVNSKSDSDDSVTVSKRVKYLTFREDNLKGKHLPNKVIVAKKTRVFTLYTLERTPPEFLKEVIANFKCLRVLNLRGCDIEIVPDSIGDLKHLRMLDLGDNARIKHIPDSLCNLLNLQSLFLDCCNELQALPHQIGNLENLRYLSLTTQEEYLSEEIGKLRSLRTFFLYNCPRLFNLPNSFAKLVNLEQLWIAYCEKLNPIGDSVPDNEVLELNNLHTLNIEGVPNLVSLRIFGESLRRLGIVKCHGLSHLSGWIGRYTSLQALSIIDCPSLMALPGSFCDLKQLQRLKIVACPSLSVRCAKDTGVDWPLISHVADIIVLDQEEM